MATQTLTIELPDTAHFPDDVTIDQDRLRYIIAGGLCASGVLSAEEARQFTGDPSGVFEEKMKGYGFSAALRDRLPSRSATEQTGPKGKSRWALVADYFRSDAAGHLDGKSDQAKQYLRDFRENFRFRE